ncbi:MAG TPA: hypothetical protein VFQ68_00730 [Streptosporangiaceae bacterium]|nr:hypothetical protein [Streptosporangiaceae bacterium]
MAFAVFPAAACRRHRGARSGFEVAYFRAAAGGWSIDGRHSSAGAWTSTWSRRR